MSPSQRRTYVLWVVLWLAALLSFWAWWLQPEHNIDSTKFIICSLVLAWVTLLPLYFVLVFSQSRVPSRSYPLRPDYRVAMVVTKAPSEPFSLVRQTLEAMLRQKYPHDTWLADEDPSCETLEWCRNHGVLVSTRKERPDYHRPSWPRRTKCKEGNLAFFYDQYGYARYDFVVQMDADHVPEDGYLEEMLTPFADPTIGYVSAPSICDKNASESWSARGRLYSEGIMHGALQAGYTGSLAPVCIGSHYAVRTAALKQIGGLGPELAEDHSTTLIMNAHGWRGMHALHAVAHGQGPETFADLAIQEFQWSRSLMCILLNYTPKYFRRLPLRLKFQFGFCQIWYPLISFIMLAMYVLPVVALVSDSVLVNVTFLEFVARSFLLSAILTGLAFWIRKNGWLRPVHANILSWEAGLFLFARWPWVMLGTLAAIKDRLLGARLDFRVTPKGQSSVRPLPLRVIAPYIVLALGSGLPVVLLDIETALGFYFIATLNSLTYATLAAVIYIKHFQENCIDRSVLIKRAMVASTVIGTFCVPMIAIPLRVPESLLSLTWGYEKLAAPISASVHVLSAGAFAHEHASLKLGVYDPGEEFSQHRDITIEHAFVPWNAPNAWIDLPSWLETVARRNRQPMLTIEPWTKAQNWRDGAHNLFRDILLGAYDQQIEAICETVGKFAGNPLLRWGHEMEDSVDRYPWAQTDPLGYVRAFRHWVTKCRALAPNTIFVWSPKGEGALGRFYPGAEYVDMVGFSVYGMQTWELSYYGKTISADQNIGAKYARFAAYNKPIMISELGVYGDRAYVTKWISEFYSKAKSLPSIKAAVYFNKKEPYLWPEPYGAPDWRTSAAKFIAGAARH